MIARNPDPESRLEYLLRVPLGDGIVLRTSGRYLAAALVWKSGDAEALRRIAPGDGDLG